MQVNLQPNAHSKGCVPACIEQSGALSLALQSQHEAIGPDMGLNRVVWNRTDQCIKVPMSWIRKLMSLIRCLQVLRR